MPCACAILSSVACPALQHFSTLFHKMNDYKILDMKLCCDFSLQLLSSTFLILRRIQGDIKMYIVLRVKYPLFFSDFNET